MTDIEWDELGPKRRARSVEWVANRMNELYEVLDNANIRRLDKYGCPHLFDADLVVFSIEMFADDGQPIDVKKWVRRKQRQVNLHRHYLGLWELATGIIVN